MTAAADAGPVFAVAGALILVVGVHGVFGRADLLGRIVALNIAASGAFTFLVGSAPVDGEGRPDTVMQALVLTGIVISVSVTAYALSLLRRIADEAGRDRLEEADGRDGPAKGGPAGGGPAGGRPVDGGLAHGGRADGGSGGGR
ncbi:NADH-quinone oxidoreductase subunit K [Azospirillum sp. ST 5-10]|uniref:NADH-quinone oxidoreductase subunit K n=1 Tax=unclassified Azospirillum TaxID=2630922 RepID=UPI003F49CB77